MRAHVPVLLDSINKKATQARTVMLEAAWVAGARERGLLDRPVTLQPGTGLQKNRRTALYRGKWLVSSKVENPMKSPMMDEQHKQAAAAAAAKKKHDEYRFPDQLKFRGATTHYLRLYRHPITRHPTTPINRHSNTRPAMGTLLRPIVYSRRFLGITALQQ